MARLLYLECSPHAGRSGSARLLRPILDEAGASGLRVTTRSLAETALEPISTGYAQAITASDQRHDDVLACSGQLIDELEHSDGVLISTPMHNFTVPAALKLWIDYVLRVGRTFVATPAGKIGLLQDKPVLVLVRSGGVCTGDDARQPDFLTPYLRHVLHTIGIRNVQFSYLAGRQPPEHAWADARRSVLSLLDTLSSTGASA
ncbi:FMN-dependent NADH-azoreductase [Paraburkholderia sp.]|uniref:FMN-dependent NADH-azoreductase n=1 Tax=Paraburkholderia sp. TaxID=1926495 RepID=UPI0039E719CC